jgi:hypothetical protein
VSDQVAYLDDLLLEDCLDEAFHGGPAPELAQRILTAASTVREASEAHTPAPGSVEGPVTALRAVPPDPEAPLSLPRWAIWLAQGTVAAGLVVLLVVLLFPRDPEIPSGVIAADDAEFVYDTANEWPAIQADAGWYLLSDGAPPLTAADTRVEDVKGTVIVKVGDIPNPDEQAAKQPWLAQHQVEAHMLNGSWIKAGALSLFIVSGSAFVDGQYLSAQAVKKERDAERKEGEVRKERKEAENDDDVKKADRVADELAKLREEVADLEERLAEARELEDEGERKARVERIENALKDKRDRIAELEVEDKAAPEGKKRDGDAAKKRREAERRKKAENDDDGAAAKERRAAKKEEEDAATKERKEAERGKAAESDDDRKKRDEDEQRKKRDAERGAKERKAARKQ